MHAISNDIYSLSYMIPNTAIVHTDYAAPYNCYNGLLNDHTGSARVVTVTRTIVS